MARERFKKLKGSFLEGERLLDHYIGRGTIWWDENEIQYVGLAADGQEVGLGNSRSGVSSYLQTNPDPEDW